MPMELVRPIATIQEQYNDDGYRFWDTIKYFCPQCHRPLKAYAAESGCLHCGIMFDWGPHEPTIKVTKTVNW